MGFHLSLGWGESPAPPAAPHHGAGSGYVPWLRTVPAIPLHAAAPAREHALSLINAHHFL